MEKDDAADGAYEGSQELSVVVGSGRYKGEEMVVYNYFGPLSGVPVSKGDSVIITIRTQSDGEYSATVYEFNRIPVMILSKKFMQQILLSQGAIFSDQA